MLSIKEEDDMTTCVLRGYYLSDVAISDIILACFLEPLEDEEFQEIMDQTLAYVNEHLPGTLAWYPVTAEIVGDVDEEYSEEAFRDLLEEALVQVIG